ncbi:homocysteine S-methyltransferase family protein [Mycoplasma sp. P36-A1]|uniref:homocysteine S-methyltransferase family protein n=1 Tax=Mycoplasma sp. P36-A1 TaxID=3252900 RepID=UPI003C2C6A31
MNIKQYIKNNFLLFDGAMGSLLQQSNIEIPAIPEELNITNPENIVDIHQKYLESGSNIILTNTFGLNPFKFENSKYKLKDVAIQAVKNAQIASSRVEKQSFIAFDIGPLGILLQPNGTLSFEKAYNAYKGIVLSVADENFDVFVVETQSDLYEVKAAVLAIKENSSKPVFVTMTFDNEKTTLLGNDVLSIVTTLEGLRVDALGLNCSFGPKQMLPLVKQFVKASSTPIMVQPNAGMPNLDSEKLEYDIDADEFKTYMKDIIEAGVQIVGGCCGTDYSHIEKVSQLIEILPHKNISEKNYTRVASATKTVTFDKEFIKVGERINPTGKRFLREAITSQNHNLVIKEAILQEDEHADIIDINMGIPKQDEAALLLYYTKLIQSYVKTPLQLDSANPYAIEAALREYNGKPIINSVNAKKESMDAIFPIIKKYGAAVIGLLIDEKGLAYTKEEKIEMAETIVKEAAKYQIKPQDIIIDCLTLTASAQQKDVIASIDAIKEIKKLGVKTILGISNVSFGLPNRDALNAAFLTMAIYQGLDSGIVNPASIKINEAIDASQVLINHDLDSKNYIQNNSKETKTESEIVAIENTLQQAIKKGLQEEVATITKKELQTREPLDIIENEIVVALNEVGNLFEQQKLYLPQLIQSAQAVATAFEIIKTKLPATDKKENKKVIVATVKGDVHDIGKNIVRVLFENYGYQVIDLGKDVSKEDILASLEANDVKVVGLSALMTTTVSSMEEIITYLKKIHPEITIIVGGAVLTQEYADKINADFYAKDALEGVDILNRIFTK